MNKYLHTVASVGFLFTLNYDARNHELKILLTDYQPLEQSIFLVRPAPGRTTYLEQNYKILRKSNECQVKVTRVCRHVLLKGTSEEWRGNLVAVQIMRF